MKEGIKLIFSEDKKSLKIIGVGGNETFVIEDFLLGKDKNENNVWATIVTKEDSLKIVKRIMNWII